MGLRHPERSAGPARQLRRLIVLAGVVVLALGLAGCSDETQAGRAGMPEIVTKQGQDNLDLWQGAWIAALATGVVTWALILGAAWYFRRRSDDEVPVQTRYNLPVEIFYTIFPIIMVIVFFAHTVRVQNTMLEMDPDPDVTIVVTGQKWTWTFNYPETGPDGENTFVSGPPPGEAPGDDAQLPELVLPVDQTIEFQLVSPDVIHDFGIPSFAMRMDVVPGRDNAFQVTTMETGTFDGKCYELCGSYHSRMLFTVRVVEQEEYDAYLADLAEVVDSEGNHLHLSDEPLTGGRYATDPYLNDEPEGEHE